MKKRFTVYDCKAEAYLPPTYFGAAGEAIRSFEAAANQEGHDFHNYAGDYTLFETGTWDEITDIHTSLEAKINLGTALQYIQVQPQAKPTAYTQDLPLEPLTKIRNEDGTPANPNHGFPLNTGARK